VNPPDSALRFANRLAQKIGGRQLHLWITEADYEFILSVAAENEETIAATVRRMIRTARRMKLTQPTKSNPIQSNPLDVEVQVLYQTCTV
jgi:hypothetical protein